MCFLIASDVFRFIAEGEAELKYLQDVQNLIRPERNTLKVSFKDVQEHNQQLATTIQEEYYRSVREHTREEKSEY